MRKYLQLVMMAGFVFDASAACPKKLEGSYSGLANYLEARIQSMNPFAVALGYAEGWAQVWKISGNTLTIVKNFKAATDGDGTLESPVSTSYTLSYDKTTCSGQVSVPGSGFIGFVVSDNGKHIQATAGSTDSPSFSTFDMFKQ